MPFIPANLTSIGPPAGTEELDINLTTGPIATAVGFGVTVALDTPIGAGIEVGVWVGIGVWSAGFGVGVEVLAAGRGE